MANSLRHYSDDAIGKALIDSIGDGVIIVNEYGVITDINQKALEMLGYTRTELVGAWFPKALPSRDKDGNVVPTYDRPAVRALLSGKPTSAVVGYVTKSGSVLPVANTSSPFTVEGRPQGAVIIFRDYSHELMVEKAKDEFISITSHQLKTPLTSMRMFIELLKDEKTGRLSRTQLEYIENLKLSTDRMLELVSNFLSISKLEIGRLDSAPESTNVEQLINMQIAELSPLLAEKNIKLTFEKPKDMQDIIVDASLLAEALHNLLANAIRYSKPKAAKIAIAIECEGKDCLISITDNGIGIPDSAKTHMFERFYRADNAADHQQDGTGLGLYLVKKIVESLKGKIWYESQENKGTTFYLSLPKAT